MSIGEDLRAFILASPAIVAIIGDNCAQNKIPQGPDELPAIFFKRGTSSDEMSLAANQGQRAQFRVSFDVEAVSESLDEVTELAELLNEFHTHAGPFGAGSVQGLFVDDNSDHYRPYSTNGDDGRHVSALDFEIIGYKET